MTPNQESDMSENKVWTLFEGNSVDAIKDTEWIAMLQVVLSGKNRKIVIKIEEVA